MKRQRNTLAQRVAQLEAELDIERGVQTYIVKRLLALENAHLSEVRRLDRLVRKGGS
jgi:hypothetical protein